MCTVWPGANCWNVCRGQRAAQHPRYDRRSRIQSMKKAQWTLLWLSIVFGACVTINIYFPAAAAEKAADRIIRDVWGVPPAPGAPASPLPPGDKTSLRPEVDQDAR